MKDANGYVIDDERECGEKMPAGGIYDAADMPYYMRLREDGVGMHAGYLPGYPCLAMGASGCRMPLRSCFTPTCPRARRSTSCREASTARVG